MLLSSLWLVSCLAPNRSLSDKVVKGRPNNSSNPDQEALGNLGSLSSASTSGNDSGTVGIKLDGPEFDPRGTQPVDLKRNLNPLVKDYAKQDMDMTRVFLDLIQTQNFPAVTG